MLTHENTHFPPAVFARLTNAYDYKIANALLTLGDKKKVEHIDAHMHIIRICMLAVATASHRVCGARPTDQPPRRPNSHRTAPSHATHPPHKPHILRAGSLRARATSHAVGTRSTRT